MPSPRQYESHASGNPGQVFDLHRAILNDLGFELRPGCKILDLGCGDGRFVRYMRSQGFDARGADIADGFREVEDEMRRSGELGSSDSPFAKSELVPYRLGFPDGTFDVVLSNEVFEHVADYGTTLDEVRRVTRPNGVNIHVFPGRYTLLEPHTFVPLGTIIRGYPWLWLWAVLGVRNHYQKGLSAREVARLNREYLIAHTFYPTLGELECIVMERFGNCAFPQREYLRHGTGRTRGMKALLAALPGGAWLFAQLRVRALYFERPADDDASRQNDRNASAIAP